MTSVSKQSVLIILTGSALLSLFPQGRGERKIFQRLVLNSAAAATISQWVCELVKEGVETGRCLEGDGLLLR